MEEYQVWDGGDDDCPTCEDLQDKLAIAIEALERLESLGTGAAYNKDNELVNGVFAELGKDIIQEALAKLKNE